MDPSELPIGAVISVPVQVLGKTITHYGIVTDYEDEYGVPLVISASKRTGRVTENTWGEFSQGSDATIYDLETPLSGREIVERARRRLGDPWELFGANCEHFVQEVLGRKRESKQLQSAAKSLAWLAVVAGAVALVVKGIDEVAATRA